MHGFSFRQLTCKCDLDLLVTGLSCVPHVTSSWWTGVPSNLGILWCMVEMWARQGTVLSNYSFWPLTSKCDLDISCTCLGLVRDTPPHHDERLCQVSLKYYDAWLKCGPDKVQSYQTVLILTLWPLRVTLTFEVHAWVLRDTPPHHGDRLCQVSFKSYDALLRCGPDKVRWDWQTDRRNRPNL